MMICDPYKIAEVVAHIATVLTPLAAAWWFFFTASFRKRVEFDVQCSVFRDPKSSNEKLIELIFALQNKGQVESRCYTLAYEVQSVDAATKGNPPEFLKRSGNIVPPGEPDKEEYYYVRAGVTARVSAHFWVPSEISSLRVKAFTTYDKKRHEVQQDKDLFDQMFKITDWTAVDRVFQISSSGGL
jgi:hypothetical protein